MSILIWHVFAILILTPISTVAIGLAISWQVYRLGLPWVSGHGSICLVWAAYKKNKPGVPTAITLGGYMENDDALTIISSNYVSRASLIFSYYSCLVPVFNLTGTPQTSGFSLVGLIIQSSLPSLGNTSCSMLLVWCLCSSGNFLVHFLFTKSWNSMMKKFSYSKVITNLIIILEE